jgi:hypothetical protein
MYLKKNRVKKLTFNSSGMQTALTLERKACQNISRIEKNVWVNITDLNMHHKQHRGFHER